MKSARDKKISVLNGFRARVHRIAYTKKVDTKVYDAAWRAKGREENRWRRWSAALLQSIFDQVDLEDEVARLVRIRKSRFRKADQNTLLDDLIARIRQTMNENAWATGASTSYVGMALDTGETAGQFSLDTLGINKTFHWANARSMGRDLYAVRGSKVVQVAYGNHVSSLAKLIVDSTDPAKPRAIGEIVKDIRESYPDLQRWQAERIARTETASVWENMNMNMMIANEVPGANVLVATGPSIGATVDPVCELCQDIVGEGPWSPVTDAPIPPYHPNCRCTLVPELMNDDGSYWLPPADTWAGGEFADLETMDLGDG